MTNRNVMTDTSKEAISTERALKLALEALEWNMGYLPSPYDGTRMAINAITALREALALVNEVDQEQPAQQQEPDLSGLKPETQKQMREWLADGSFVERAISALQDQERRLMAFEKAQQQEPVAWITKDGDIYKHACWPEYEARPLVFGDTSPPAQRKPLTDDEIENIQFSTTGDNHIDRARNLARAIEAAHGITKALSYS